MTCAKNQDDKTIYKTRKFARIDYIATKRINTVILVVMEKQWLETDRTRQLCFKIYT